MLVFHGEYSYRDERGHRIEPPWWTEDSFVSAYGLVNAQIGYVSGDGKWEAFLWGRNLTDEAYALGRGQSFLGVPSTRYGEPRSYGLRLKYHF